MRKSKTVRRTLGGNRSAKLRAVTSTTITAKNASGLMSNAMNMAIRGYTNGF